jgi:type IV pilus assembly protein PilY1
MKERRNRRPFEQHREDRMKSENRMTREWGLWAATVVGALALSSVPAGVSAQNMADYTNYPIFLSQTVPPNILFLVDMGNYTLEAAYGGTNERYWISFKSGTATSGTYSSNVTVKAATASADPLVAVDNNGVAINTSNVTSPADTFDSTKSYYGMFDSFRCYTTGSNSFNYASVKVNVSDACAAANWDGNFLNWLTQAKKQMIYQVLVGGEPIPAQANQDGTANTLSADPKTGENGSTNTCNSDSKSCWRFVKYVPSGTLTGRVPTTLPTAASTNVSLGAGTVSTVSVAAGTVSSGIFFGVGEGTLYINDNATPSPFDNAPANQYGLTVNLLSEPNVPSGTGSYAGNCIVGDPNYAGHLICYQRDRSLGLFQTMRTDNMHVAVMFVNASTGQGGSLQYPFDGAFNASTVTNIRNQHTAAYGPLSEALYEGLCLFSKSQGPCYSNSGSWSTGYSSGGIGQPGDPFFFASMNQEVRCAKCFVLMISPGKGVGDGNAPDLQTPFGNLFSGTNIGIDYTQAPWNMTAPNALAAGDRLDDVAYYGHTHDLRSDLTGTQSVAFYAVNAMGGPNGATLLASAAKYGGFVDRNNDNAVDLTGTQACTYPAGSKLGSGASTSNPEWDLNQDCVPDTFFDASEGGDLAAQINAAIADILKKAASGTSISVLASSSTGEGALFQAFFYPSTFEGTNEIKWTGFVQGLFVDPFGNLREDRGGPSGAPDGKLVYSDDNIVVTRTDPTSGDVVVDRFYDVNPADGLADSTTPYETVSLRQMQGLWEAGKQLALRDISSTPRNLITWVDLNNNGVVDSGEQMAFSTANASTLCPYLLVSNCGTSTAPATDIINFIQGAQVPGKRNRQVTVNGALHVWKLGDVVNSTPTIVGAPKERYDILYGDPGYRHFVAKWANRRQQAYVGANDGLLHAFNIGYYHRGDDPTTTSVTEHGWYTKNPADNSSGTGLGEEVWGFVPYHLLPQLGWYTQTNYTHISYVDQKPKVTDVHIFTQEAACGGGTTPTNPGCIHPDGWGTILIAGLRFGGSCGACASVSSGNNGGPPLKVVADFNGNGNTTDVNDTRYFYSGYIVLDITDPDATPTVLGVYSSSDLGLTTSYPTVARMNLSTDATTTHTNSKWFMVFGSGVHGYDGRAAALANIVAVELGTPLGTAPSVTKMPVGSSWYSFVADPITLDKDLDFRSDAIYVGRTIDPTSSGIGYWTGKMYRLTMGTCSAAPCSTSTWGIALGASRAATEMLDTFNMTAGLTYLGPSTSSPTVTLDDTGEVWVFFGTGRFLSVADKSDTSIQYLLGIKDSVLRAGGCSQTSVTSCWDNNLLDVSNLQICVTCAAGSNQVNGISGTTSYVSLMSLIKGMDGWVTNLPTSGERSIVPPTIIAGAVLFPTFIPTSDICVAAGSSNLYALFYKTGGAYPEPIIGVDASGHSQRSMSLGQGLASSVAIQIGAAPTGVAGFYQTSGANIGKLTPNTPLSAWSEYISWVSRRD